MIEKLYTVEEVADLASVTGRTIRNYLKSGRLVGRKIGGQWRFPESEVQRLLAGGAAEDDEPAPHYDDELPYELLDIPETTETASNAAPAPQPQQAQQPPMQQTAGGAYPPAGAGAMYPQQQAAPQQAAYPQPVYQQAPYQQQTPQPQYPQQQAAMPQMMPEGAYATQPPAQMYTQPVYQQPGYAAAPYAGAQPQAMYPYTGAQATAQHTAPAPIAGQPAPIYDPVPMPAPQEAVSTQSLANEAIQEAIPAEELPATNEPEYEPPVPPSFFSAPGKRNGKAAKKQQDNATNLDDAADDASKPKANHKQEKAKAASGPELSDVGKRVAQFSSEIHDVSDGPQMCSVIDQFQTLDNARVVSEQLAQIARQESEESGIECRSFVEYDARYNIARYTLFGSTSFLSRSLMLIG